MFQDGSAGQQAEAGRRLVHAQDERCEEGGDQRHGDQGEDPLGGAGVEARLRGHPHYSVRYLRRLMNSTAGDKPSLSFSVPGEGPWPSRC